MVRRKTVDRPSAVVVTMGLALTMLLAGCASTRGTRETATEHSTAIDQHDIVYAAPEGVELKLDIVVPSGKGPFPAIIFFPGNGFGYYYAIDRGQCRSHLLELVKHGYVVLEADVRTSVDFAGGTPTHVYPAPVYDAKAAVRWLRANAETYHVDPERVGAAGWSSGGILALMLALTRPADGLEGDEGTVGYSTAVTAVAITGVEVNFDYEQVEEKPGIKAYLGKARTDSPELYRVASPIHYLKAGAPPILQIEAGRDHYSVDQAPSFHARLEEFGVPHQLLTVPDMGHADFLGRPECLAFFDRYLKE